MNRRAFVTGLGAMLAATRAVEAQQVPSRVAVVVGSSPLTTMMGAQPTNLNMRAFLEGLRDLGYVEGRNILIERRALEGRMDQVPAVIGELLRLKVEVILAAPLDVALAIKGISSTIPIVVVDASHEGPNRIADSLARPGGNVTGLSGAGPGIAHKLLALLKEAVPHASRVTVLTGSTDAWVWQPDRYMPSMEAAAKSLGLTLSWVEAKSLDEVPGALQVAVRQRPDAVLIMGFAIFYARLREIAAFIVQRRLPAASTYREFVDEGLLMSYADPLPERFRRAATYVDKILRGATPATLPIELPTKYEVRVNLKTAKALGLTIPPSLLLRADQVIE
jgi:putative ABC transport system substrate-binding protein